MLEQYNEKHRFYHNANHISYIKSKIDELNISNLNKNILHTVADYHDVVYDPKESDNEEKSVDFFKLNQTSVSSEYVDIVCNIIMDTKLRVPPESALSRLFWEIDNSILLSDFKTLLSYEDSIFKEYQFVSYDVYKQKRIDFLQNTIYNEYFKPNSENLFRLIDYIETRKVNVGLYVGSFNPFHLGHLNIINKAEKIFDKVVILLAQNEGKETNPFKIPDCLKYKQVDILKDPLTTDYIKNNITDNVKITLVRGLRNSVDLLNEQNLLSYMVDFYPDLNFVFITCDKQYNHISSSDIRKNKDATKAYII